MSSPPRDIPDTLDAWPSADTQRYFVQALLTHESLGMMMLDCQGTALLYNHCISRMLGCPRGQFGTIYSWIATAIADPQDRQELDIYFRGLRDGSVEQADILVAVGEQQGQSRIVNLNTSVIRDNDGDVGGMLVIATDATEHQATEQQLIRAERLAAIGELAASLAHEIKNPLTGISSAIQVISTDMTPDDPRREVVREILHQINRLDATIKALLAYARPHPLKVTTCQIRTIIDHVMNLLAQETDARQATVSMHTDDDLPCIQADPNQYEQVMLNILLNALQSRDYHAQVQVRLAAADDHLLLTVTDNGCGMTSGQIERAFEPFYTQKSRGTGLGLPICKKIIDAHGGDIQLDSTPDEGTTVTWRIPIRLQPLTAAGTLTSVRLPQHQPSTNHKEPHKPADT